MAVVTDGAGTDKKGYNPPENELAAGLAKYFESRTEIEYSVLIDKMKEVPEGDILKLLGIKSKDTEEEKEPKIEKEDEIISPEDEKKADEFMEELKQQAKEELEKANADKKAKEEAIKQQEDKAKKLAEKKLNEEENKRDIKQKEKSPGKVCSVNMGKKVPNKSPIKIVSSGTDSDCVIVDSDTNDKMEKNGKIDTNKEQVVNDKPLNLSIGKRVETDTDAASSSGIYFSDSDEFHKAVEMSKENNGVKRDMKEGETATEDNGVEESSDSGGVFFSDE